MLTFRNKGLVDLRAITTFGVNSKDTKSPIGQFGTGFKYAVAVALRMGATITVFRGLEFFQFTARRETIRNDEFGIVYLNDQPLGFTTHVGAHWQPWQVFRELYCNMLDEADGEAFDHEIDPEEGYTHVYLNGPAFDAVWAERDKIVLPQKRKLAYFDEHIEIIEGPSPYVYYRGVRVGEWKTPALFTYNILDRVKLTEDRTLENLWEVEHVVKRAVRRMQDKALLRRMLVVEGDVMEAVLDYASYADYSAEFYDVVHRARANKDLNKLALVAYRVKNPEVTMPAAVAKTRQETKDLKEALQLCAVLGYDIKQQIVITDELPDSVLGQVFPKHSEKIYIARRAFTMGLLTVAGTLLEEHIHLKYGLLDETRQMQNHLFDVLMRAAQRILLEKRGGVVPLAAPPSKEE